MDKTKLYFAYGANMSKSSMASRCPQAQPVKKFFLRDWRLRLHNHATVAPAEGYYVAGALWAITEDCERNLDHFEGWPVYYQKREIEQDGERIMFYVMNDFDYGDPSPGYVRLLEQGYQDWDLPQSWLQETLLTREYDYGM